MRVSRASAASNLMASRFARARAPVARTGALSGLRLSGRRRHAGTLPGGHDPRNPRVSRQDEAGRLRARACVYRGLRREATPAADFSVGRRRGPPCACRRFRYMAFPAAAPPIIIPPGFRWLVKI